MSLKTWIPLMFGFTITLRSSAKLCMRRYVNGEWISDADCWGPERMLEMQKELQLGTEDRSWIVFQRKVNGDVDFYRSWDDYGKGFGNSEGDLWLGLEELNERTKDGNMELEINMIAKDTGAHLVAKYSDFWIGPGSDNYTLHVSGYSGNATIDGLSYHSNREFSSKDVDNDPWPTRNCASTHESGWWYGSCATSNLNGNFNNTSWKGIWWGYTNDFSPHLMLRFSEMKFRRRS